jgi:hypothetical protein
MISSQSTSDFLHQLVSIGKQSFKIKTTFLFFQCVDFEQEADEEL